MDFHTLSRRDLQALCKKNKIPANITNVAMAEALQSLQTVEGLAEVLAHPATETPARSVTASNRQRAVKEETVTSKVTRTNRGTKKVGEETAAPTASLKVQSTVKSTQNSTVQQAYSTRRSTRILEKQMCDLTLKESDDMLDAKAILQKDSQDMQRQFSEDMESSQDLNDETFDESEVSKEDAAEEPIILEVPLQHMDTVLENELPTSEISKQLENAGDEVEPFMKLENEAVELEKSSNQKESKDDEVQPMQEDAVDLDVTQFNVNVANSAQRTPSAPRTEPESDNRFFAESDSNANEKATVIETPPMQEGVDQFGVDNALNAVSGLNTITMDEHVVGSEDTVAAGTEEIGSCNIPSHTLTEADDVESGTETETESEPESEPESESEPEPEPEVEQRNDLDTCNLPSHTLTEADDVESGTETASESESESEPEPEPEVEQRNDLDTRSTEISDDEFDFLSESESSESQSEEVELHSTGRMNKSESTAEKVNEVTKDCISNQSSYKKSGDNQEKFALQDENMPLVGRRTRTPLEKKSLTQLKKMVKEKEEALRVRKENI